MKTGSGKRRKYQKTTRAESERATGEAISAAALRAFTTEPFDRVTLQSIAEESGVTVQTVIRRFGTKEALFEALVSRESERVLSSRNVPADASMEEAVGALVQHYEHDGDTVLSFMAQERISEPIQKVVNEGRRVHREWVEEHLLSLLVGRDGTDRDRVLYAAIAATDLGTWKLLRRDLGLGRGETTAVMIELLNGLKRRH